MAKIEYINISGKEWDLLSNEKRKEKPYCIEYSNGNKCWRVNLLYHHEDGPAIEYADGNKLWFLNGVEYSFERFLEKTSITDEEKIFLKLKYS